MAVGSRQQPEKLLDSKFCTGFKRISRKRLKQEQNRKDRRLARLDPETPPRAKYYDWEW